MLTIPGYQIHEMIAKNKHTIVYRGIREADGATAILKTLNVEYPAPKDLARLRLEYELVKGLDHEGVSRPYGLEKVGNRLVFIMEDFGAISLKQWIRERKPSVADCLEVAIRLADILGAIHLQDVIHKDVKPSNIVINPDTGRIGVIDFSIASRLNREKQKVVNVNYLEGSLAYISPEQTGRMNRHIDYRTDLYSLGVTLYEMTAGRLPFQTQDALSMVHCHLAEAPQSPDRVNADISATLSAIILKLMAKTVESRYQSAIGLRADLEECLARIQDPDAAPAFEIGRSDMPLKLQISQKLYGREQEIAALMAAFDKVSAGETQLMLVAGYSGVGKSALIGEVHKPIVARRGFFIASKFDQYLRNIPFQAVSEAFQGLIRQILAEDEAQIAAWKEALTAALGDRGQVIVDVIPELELVIGAQPEVTRLEGEVAKRRFIDVFEHFLGVFTTEEHPLVFFLDDLQWADQASLDLLQSLTTGKAGHHLLILGAYRDNEVNPSHPLMLALDKIAEKRPFDTIELPPLDRENTNLLIADSLFQKPDQTRALAELMRQKTHGNPFFLGQFLNTLYVENLVRFDLEAQSWTWSLAKIRAMEATDNVVELMAMRINKRAAATRELLRLASCLGNAFDLETLSVISDREPREAADGLWEAVREGLIVPQDDTYRYYRKAGEEGGYLPEPRAVVYKFLHDRIHEAAYSLMSPQDAEAVHLRIGQLLLARVSAAEREERIFDLVNHLNLGSALVEDQDERDRIAKLNLVAAKKARAATAHSAALDYCVAGIGLLGEPEAAWRRRYPAMFELHRDRTECEYLCGNMEQAEAVFAETLAHAANKRDKANIYELMMGAYMKFGRFTEGVKYGKDCLELFDVALPAIDDPDAIQAALDQEYKNIEALIAGKDAPSIAEAPEADDPDLAIVMSMLHQTWNNCYFAEGLYDLGTVAALRIAALSLAHGMTNYSSFGFVTYGLNLCFRGDYEEGYQFGLVGIKLQERFENIHLVAKINNLFAHFISHYKRHFRNNIPHYETSYRACLQTADLWYGIWAVNYIPHIRLMMGDPLDEVYAEALKYTPYARNSGVDMMWELLNLDIHIILNLQGVLENEDRFSFDDDAYNEERVIAMLKSVPYDFGLFWHDCYKSFVHYLYEAYEPALELSMSADKNKNTAPGLMLSVDQHFYNSLIISANWDRFDEADREKHRKILDENLARMKVWGEHGKENYEHKYLAMRAEQARIDGDHETAMDAYDQAIDSARAYGFMQNEAIVNELAARYFVSRGREKIARGYMTDAFYLYHRWGAVRKAEDLENRYPHLIIQGMSQHISDLTSTTVSSINSRLDLDAVMKAFQAISSEIVLSALLKQVMNLVILNAGAGRGALLLEREGRWFVKARGGKEGIEYIEGGQRPVEGSVDMPLSVVHYVAKTRENVVLNDAPREGMFAGDPYIVQAKPKSILCAPILHQGKLSGILYLENNLSVGAFTADRVDLLQLLCSQAAISLENARLYNSLEEYSQNLEAKVEERTRELSKKNLQIVSSLQYAQRIQRAILPEMARIKLAFPECFVFFQPREIVSGDFFWFSQRDRMTFLAVVDCTGHGVPGAFMSLIGNTLLNQIINEKKIYEPSKALSLLHTGVRQSLKQEGVGATTDGMEMALCCIDADNGVLTFAGARRPLFLFRHGRGDQAFEEIKGDRKSIGGRQKEARRKFTDHRLPYRPGDCIYLTTDGFVDQPNPDGAKYGSRRLRQFLTSMGPMGMDAQETALVAEWRAHQGAAAQRDDVTIIGVSLA